MVISIHAPREGGDCYLCHLRLLLSISIHAPREGGDMSELGQHQDKTGISIHAPREGGDRCALAAFGVPFDFNPRPPRGGRLEI